MSGSTDIPYTDIASDYYLDQHKEDLNNKKGRSGKVKVKLHKADTPKPLKYQEKSVTGRIHIYRICPPAETKKLPGWFNVFRSLGRIILLDDTLECAVCTPEGWKTAKYGDDVLFHEFDPDENYLTVQKNNECREGRLDMRPEYMEEYFRRLNEANRNLKEAERIAKNRGLKIPFLGTITTST